MDEDDKSGAKNDRDIRNITYQRRRWRPLQLSANIITLCSSVHAASVDLLCSLLDAYLCSLIFIMYRTVVPL
jgi:hypothetical protein